MVTAAVSALVFFAFVGGALWWALALPIGLKNAAQKRAKAFPQTPRGFTAPRMSGCPYDMKLAGEILSLLVDESAKEYAVTRTAVREALRNANIYWVETEVGQPLIDEWGRKVWGLFDGKDCTVAWFDGLEMRDSAFCYELLRAIKKSLGHGDWMVSNRVDEDSWPEADWEMLARVRIGSGK